MHNDQHGTAIVVLAALMNALRIIGKSPAASEVVINGAGAAGIATARLLTSYGVRDIIKLASRMTLAQVKARLCAKN